MEMSCRPLPYGAHVTKVTAVFLGPHPNKETVNIVRSVFDELCGKKVKFRSFFGFAGVLKLIEVLLN